MGKIYLVSSRRLRCGKQELVAAESDDEVVYVEDSFTYSEYAEAYRVVLEACETAAEKHWIWRIDGSALWRVFARFLFSLAVGDLKHLLVIGWEIERALKKNPDEVVIVWPEEDIIRDMVDLYRKKAHNGTVLRHIVADERTNPVPRSALADRREEERPKTVRPFLYTVILEVILTLGKVVKSASRLIQQNPIPESLHSIVYASNNNREITDELRKADGIAVSPLRPFIYECLMRLSRLLKRSQSIGDFQGQEDYYAEDFLSVPCGKAAVTYIMLRRTAQSFARDVHVALSKKESGRSSLVPSDYVEYVAKSFLNDEMFLKHLVYLLYWQDTSNINTVVSVSGGITQEMLTSIADVRGMKVADLNHSVLMLTPVEIENQAHLTLVKSRSEYRALREYGREGALKLTGRPYNQALRAKLQQKDRQDPLEGSSRPEMRRLVLATEPLRDEHRLNLLRFVNRADNLDEVVIKPHPSESRSFYQAALQGIGTGPIRWKLAEEECDLVSLVLGSSVVVTPSSNVGLEAWLLGVPAIHLNMPCNIRLHYQEQERMKKWFVRLEELPRAISRAVDGGADFELVCDLRSDYQFDGQESVRVIKAVQQLATTRLSAYS